MFIVLLFIVFVIWYHMPIHINKSVSLSTLDGSKQAEAKIDVTWHRYFFSPTELKGTIILDGTEYVSINKLINVQYGNGFFDQLPSKFRNERNVVDFVIPQKNMAEPTKEDIRIGGVGDKFEVIFLIVSKDREDLYEFYGPAKTSEEAHNVLERMKKIKNLY
ncbi:hypothetical protein ACFFF5_06200 [Lederbergia wuyishanensis]|uniref:Uncharacterized protein n=1 Tax=Lederbergia wuyishanensis TaxID=1347903 RepID=A0ABU0D321_9BACI|nr:hypothetical protein [Lederbergia wuyishanensis]MCJ8007080.1 hypothetical protein [Lederbergia wuyishanensis]MDQ0342776.1 hypothetical protein [Lederbergia wuyishanensis]